MLVLGMDTTSVTASASLVNIEDGKAESVGVFTVKRELKHSENLMIMLDGVLSLMGKSPSDIELYAVTTGPGSFTGVRIGVTTVKGMAIVRDTPCVGVSSLEAVAYNQSTFDVICPVMDARRGQFYTSLYKWDEEKLVSLAEEKACPIEEIKERLKPYGKIIMCGDGTRAFKELYDGDKELFYAKDSVREQDAFAVAMLGYEKYINGEVINQGELSPRYLRGQTN